ncbi:MAG TPA: CHRD domain-containing protein [Sulfuricella sp.]|nr:CHRD domain-containing protein [Sulfuricella sp.]
MNTLRVFNRLGFLVALAAAAISLAAATSMVFGDEIKVTLSGGNEVPPVMTEAAGSGTVMINSDMTVSGSVMTTGIAGTMAHIHQGAAGKNGPVIIKLSKDGDHGWMVPAGAKLTDAQYQAYKAGELYINVHSAANKGGEIRGQLK